MLQVLSIPTRPCPPQFPSLYNHVSARGQPNGCPQLGLGDSWTFMTCCQLACNQEWDGGPGTESRNGDTAGKLVRTSGVMSTGQVPGAFTSGQAGDASAQPGWLYSFFPS